MAINVSEVSASIRTSQLKWIAAENALTALSDAERRLRLGALPPAGERDLAAREVMALAQMHLPAAAAGVGATPAAYDARSLGWVTPVVDQGGCGSCVAFGTTAAVEAAVRIAANQPGEAVSLSEAQVFYCYGKAAGADCASGWWPDGALNGFQQGVVDSACFPYAAGDQNCNLCANWQSRLTKITKWHTLSNVNDMKAWISSHGPVTTCFTVHYDFFAYSSGVYSWNGTSTVDGGHCVCVVGYNDAGGYWICKNSWGTGFGESGFFCIAYGQCGIDAEMWAIDGIVSDAIATGPIVSAARNTDGRLEIFGTGTDKALYHQWEDNAHAGPWSGWASLGGGLTSAVSAAVNTDGRIEVFARGEDNALWHIWMDNPHAGPWSAWSSLGGGITSDPCAVVNTDGRIEVFARGNDNALWHIWMDNPHAGPWSAWSSLGGVITSDPVAVVNSDGRVEVFARGTDGGLWHIWMENPHAGPWSTWASLGGGITSDPAAVVNSDGRVEVFARGTDNALWHIWQENAHAGPWSGWASLGGAITCEPAAAVNSDGRMEVFARGTDNALWHIWQAFPHAGPWSAWESLGGGITSAPSAIDNSDGRLEVFARGEDGALWHIWQIAPHSAPWSGWASLGGILLNEDVS